MLFDLPPLGCLHAFEAAARHGSFAAAAKELHLTQSAVSHRIRQLERHLGYDLFDRSPRSLALNDMGQAYLPSLQQAFNEIAGATAGLFGSGKKRTVTIRVPIAHAVLWLAPRIDSFLTEYPDIDIRLGSTIWSDMLPREQADLELRFGSGNWDKFETLLLRQEVAIPVCSQQHFDRFGPPGSLLDLSRRLRINTLGYDNLWQRLFRGEGLSIDTQTNCIWVDTTLAAIEVAAASTRCAIIPESLLASNAVGDRLMPAFDVSVKMHEALYLLTPTGKREISTQAQLFKQWLQDQI